MKKYTSSTCNISKKIRHIIVAYIKLHFNWMHARNITSITHDLGILLSHWCRKSTRCRIDIVCEYNMDILNTTLSSSVYKNTDIMVATLYSTHA